MQQEEEEEEQILETKTMPGEVHLPPRSGGSSAASWSKTEPIDEAEPNGSSGTSATPNTENDGKNEASERIPGQIPLSENAKVLWNLAAWIGAEGSGDAERSFATLLLACLSARHPVCAWLRRYAEAHAIRMDLIESRAGMAHERAEGHLASAMGEQPSGRKIDWTESAIAISEAATGLAKRTTVGEPVLHVRHLVASYIYAPGVHAGDLASFGFDRKSWSNAFISRIARTLPAERPRWEELHSEIFDEPASPALVESGVPFTTDLWTTRDTLGHSAYADAIYYFLIHKDTRTPLSISIQAPWGAGKTSLMRMVQQRLDPDAEEAARLGGWRELKKQREQERQGKIRRLKLGHVVRFLRGNRDPLRIEEPTSPGSRWTIWFNTWKYENSEQLWAGLVDAIVTQITDRLSPARRELFLLQLNLARLDNNVIRQRIYERVFIAWWSTVRPLLVALGCITLGLLGVRLSGIVEDYRLNAAIAGLPSIGGIYAVFAYFLTRWKAATEPAKFILSDYIKVPDYAKASGIIHQVHDDLRKVFSAIPEDRRPLVVFIDDLDRCAPDKVAKVIEGINLFMAGDLLECMFVIGMDPQMVATALQSAHSSLLEKLPSYDRRTPIGWRFMDKFVQMAFTIPPSDRDEVIEYTDALMAEEDGELVGGPRSISATNGRAPIGGPAGNGGPDAIPGAAQREIIASQVLAGEDAGVRRMMRDLAPEFSRNPRDLKRLLNLLRFQVLVTRLRAADGRRAPHDAQLQRWITLSLRSPDAVRWLQWTPGHPINPDGRARTGLLSERLAALEAIAARVSHPDLWKASLIATFGLHEAGVSWLDDPELLAFFQREVALPEAERLSAGALQGYW
jgi:KAP-like P-loop domain-containing protein